MDQHFELPINAITTIPNHEKVSLTPLKQLAIIVHPSFLFENLEYDNHSGPYRTEDYLTRTRELQNILVQKYSTNAENHATMIMPFQEATGESLKVNKAVKEKDSRNVTWTDLHQRIIETSSNPQNIMVVGDLGYWTLSNNIETDTKNAQTFIVDKLNRSRLDLTEETEIILAGEFRDACVAETAKKLMLLSQIKLIKIDKFASTTSAYGTETGRPIEDDIEGAEYSMRKDLETYFDYTEDDRFVYLKKRE